MPPSSPREPHFTHEPTGHPATPASPARPPTREPGAADERRQPRSGRILPHVSTVESARDMDIL
ncbi:hypothetical protein, partial [Streptomyces lavendulocolor]|uniref:hypothetical protein n=1 Tax=Streptomyces lavendulocolor TaxID=67316 RepID=UPI0033D677F9